MPQESFHVAMLIMGFTIVAVGIVLYIKQFGRNEAHESNILGCSFKFSNSARATIIRRHLKLRTSR